jgi:hypothetical protein
MYEALSLAMRGPGLRLPILAELSGFRRRAGLGVALVSASPSRPGFRVSASP